MPESFERGALTEATFLILISLLQPRHGYGVMQCVAAATKNRVGLGAGTLYGAINLLLGKKWIAEAGGEERKKLYVTTPEGKRAVVNEMYRLRELLEIGGESLSASEAADSIETGRN